MCTKYGANLYRYKGLLAVKGMDKKFVFQGVGMLFGGEFADKKWKRDEVRTCRFVFIGKNIDKDELTNGFKSCMASELRFKPGDKVEARRGGSSSRPAYVPGTIISTWDEGNPYRIELDDGEGTNVWGPEDSDDFVRARK